MKICTKCKIPQDKSEFHKGRPECKACRKKIGKEFNSKEENKEKRRVTKRKYYKNNHEKIRAYSSSWSKKNIEKHKLRLKKFKENNPEYFKLWMRNRKATDLSYRILHTLRSRVHTAIRDGKNYKSTKELLGCDLDFLLEYLKERFQPGMSWDNYGKHWEIDHIIPCDYFDLTDIEQQKTCFHFSNLQPLTIYQNRSKRNKILNPELLK